MECNKSVAYMLLELLFLHWITISIQSKSPQNPCSVPTISDDDFESVCAAVIRRRFICLPPTSQSLSASIWTELESIIDGKFAFCRYDSLQRQAKSEPIGNERILVRWDRLEQALRRRGPHRSGKELRGNQSPVYPHLRPLAFRPKFGLTIIDSFQPTTSSLSSHECGIFAPSHLVRPLSFDYLANVTRAKWSHTKCRADIAVLIMGVPYFEGQTDPPMVLRVALSEKFEKLMGANVSLMVEMLNAERHPLSSMSKLLHQLLTTLTRLLSSEYPYVGERPLHSIPLWASIIFATCIIVTILAVLLGNYVSQSRLR